MGAYPMRRRKAVTGVAPPTPLTFPSTSPLSDEHSTHSLPIRLSQPPNRSSTSDALDFIGESEVPVTNTLAAFSGHSISRTPSRWPLVGSQRRLISSGWNSGVVLAIGPTLLWKTDRSNVGYQSSAFRTPIHAILSSLDDVLELVELWAEAPEFFEGGVAPCWLNLQKMT